ncbi:diphosphomevalonate/mevalonate 3,5-bisphosphate decarboxylase family protein [Apibacter sp. HY039]|uniref:diphosphomevalonate/mevalonate 3,5-bisphosphate decarboxylase family protein n=1 Tax=Apibacter sp. HY039 TaxID=2501476 RepID=UPI000FEBFB7B|nr:diphosphomevalonate decarboxylase [Apibacter sp. HY039]
MTESDFISTQPYALLEEGEVKAQCSSNIALIKYWGKYEPQLPANPSISYTLTDSYTQTTVHFKKTHEFAVHVFLESVEQEEFSKKIKKYLSSIQKYIPFVENYEYTIHTHNSFPHSSGIASSASGFGAIAQCMMEISEKLGETMTEEYKIQKASFLARLGSGSACRSLYKGLAVWGRHPEIPESSDLYAVPYPFEVHPDFTTFQDTVLLIHEGVKEVSSTVGHGLMNNHPYAEARFTEAVKNLSELSVILQNGDLDAFGRLVEHEALTLHAMMMTSQPAFILMKTGTVAAIEKIWKFRKETKTHLFFTLDAGANLHLLYPEKEKGLISSFIKNDLVKYTENGNIILDKVLF